MSEQEKAPLEEGASLEEVRAFFADDRFATKACNARIVEAGRGHAVCEFVIEEIHRNAMGGVMGGAIFTLADFALAIASNVGEAPTVSVSNSIEFVAAAKGEKLRATCDADKSGRSLGFYTVRIVDDFDRLVAIMTATCYR
ncbi:PaaI family thioesterase [Raoultibacter phocaeensis]|uniref:PaaI family thioesterase n=1 Tax=Raoultibacter phocaeensis TaxID=2479841 RepID=UPI00111B87F3|nr:PaaI family thioesterase [Raoultibacter phocaeensis]